MSDKVILELASKLGVSTNEVITQLTKKQFVEGFTDVCVVLFLWLVAGLLARVAFKARGDGDDDVALFVGVFSVATIILSMVGLQSALTNLLTPEAKAIEHLISLIK